MQYYKQVENNIILSIGTLEVVNDSVTEITETEYNTHAGTIEDPIPASRGMEYVKGLYYIENNVIYLMNRQGMQDGESVVLQYMPSELVGQYFEIVG